MSFNYDLNQLALAIFRPGTDLKVAQDNIPIFGEMLKSIRPETMAALNAPPTWESGTALAIMLGLAAFVIWKRVRPE